MTIIYFAGLLALFELVLLWLKTTANRASEKMHGSGYRIPLFESGPWWARLINRLWFFAHIPAMAFFIPVTIVYYGLGKKEGIIISTVLTQMVNFLILISLAAWALH